MTDEKLMQQFQEGNDSAFQLLFERYRIRLFRFIFNVYLHDPSLAEDYTQEIFLRVIRSKETFDPRRCFSTWLYTIAKNYCRSKRSKPFILMDAELNVEDMDGPGTANGAKRLETDDINAIIVNQVSQLPEKQRIVFTMRQINDCSHRQIAELLDVTEGSVRTLFHRAKQQLRKALQPYLEKEL